MLFSNNEYPQEGKVKWIGIRPSKTEEQLSLSAVNAIVGQGLEGDRYQGKSGKRDVSLIQAEHLEIVARLLGKAEVPAKLTRRNIVISGVNLISLKGKTIRLGGAELLVTGPCAPCSKMETNLGPGGYNAMRGHGGITARVVKTGTISVGNTLEIIE